MRAAGGSVALVDALLSGEAAAGFSAHAAARAPRRAAAGDGVLLLRQRRGGGAARAGGVRRRAGADRRLGRPPRQRDQRDLPLRTRASCSSRSTSGRCIRGQGRRPTSGAGEGEGYTVNLPVPGGSGDETYRSLVDHVVLPLIAAWEPGLVLVSAGFDAHGLDPLATCRVTERGYAEMTASLRRACAAVGAPLGLVLEGGYSLEALTGSVAALMPVLVGGLTAGGRGRGARSTRSPWTPRERLAPWWPGVGAPRARPLSAGRRGGRRRRRPCPRPRSGRPARSRTGRRTRPSSPCAATRSRRS